MKNTKWLGVLLACSVLLTTTGCRDMFTSGKGNAGDDGVVTIYHTNDMHGKVNSVYQDDELTQIGLDMVKAAKDSTPNSLLLDAGDATQGAALATYSKGEDIIHLMNLAGYDAMVPGNHEFDYGTQQFVENAQQADFPILCSNVLWDGEPITAAIGEDSSEYMVCEVAGKRIGVFGLTTVETAYKTSPVGLAGTEFTDEIAAAQKLVTQLRETEKVDAVVALVHMGISDSSLVTSHRLAQEIEGIDVILDGHSHSVDQTLIEETNTLVVQTGSGSTNLGKVTLSFTKKGVEVECQLLSAAEMGAAYTADADMTNQYNQMMADLAPILGEEVGFATTPLYGGSYHNVNIGRMEETNLGSLVADAMVDAGRQLIEGTEYEGLHVIGMQNGGSVRATVPAGMVTVGNIVDVLPFGNCLALQEITPALLFEVLENGVAEAVDGGNGAFPQISGLRFAYDTAGSPRLADQPEHRGNRVVNAVLVDKNGKDLEVLDRADTTTRLVLSTSDYQAQGGDHYDMLGSLPVIAEGGTLDSITQAYIRSLCKNTGSFAVYTQGRITLTENGSKREPYTAAITLMQGADPLANSKVNVQVDGKALGAYTTDGDGVLQLSGLLTGGHQVAITADAEQAFAFVSDLSGLTENTAALATLPGNPGTGDTIIVGVAIALMMSAGAVVALRKKK